MAYGVIYITIQRRIPLDDGYEHPTQVDEQYHAGKGEAHNAAGGPWPSKTAGPDRTVVLNRYQAYSRVKVCPMELTNILK